MKRKLIFALGILLFFCFVSSNCSAQSSNNDQRIVGTWTVTYRNNNTVTFVFNANGTGTATGSKGSDSFTYGVNLRGEMKLIYSDGSVLSWEPYFSPDGRTMIENLDIYRKK